MVRRLQLLVISTVLLVAAFSTGLPFLFYLVYLAILVVGGSYVLTRLGLSDLEAGYAVSQLHGHVGDTLRVTYTLRNVSRVPKLWLEVHNPTSLPGGLPGRAIGLGSRAERSWLIRAAASIADKALLENRSVGMTVNSHRMAILPADRGGRQHLKIMQLLAAVDGDATTPLVEVLVASVSRLRRGMTAVVITPSLDASWVRPLATLRSRGVGCVAVTLDAGAYER